MIAELREAPARQRKQTMPNSPSSEASESAIGFMVRSTRRVQTVADQVADIISILVEHGTPVRTFEELPRNY
jgi:hypothetical protein